MHQVRKVIEAAVERNVADAVLLSGGLDTSIVASIASRRGPFKAYTVALEDAPSPDNESACLMANRLKLDHKLHVFDMDELMRTLPKVIGTLHVFDPMEIRNSVAVYIGLKQVKQDGGSTFLTGDACDELFAGYSFLFNLDAKALKSSLEKLWKVMSFSAIPMGRSLGITAKIPFLDPEVRRLAGEIDPSFLVVEQDGRKWGNGLFEKRLKTCFRRRSH